MNILENYVKEYNVASSIGENSTGSGSLPITLELLSSAGYRSSMSVADYGCGWGSLLGVISPLLYNGYDISPDMIRIAHEKYPSASFSLNTIGETAGDKADFVVAHSVFTHVPKSIVSLALDDIKSLLKNDGVALIDIYYDVYGSSLYASYEHNEWLDILDDNGLQGVYLLDRDRPQFAVHHYYTVRLA